MIHIQATHLHDRQESMNLSFKFAVRGRLLINFKIKFIQLYISKYATHAHAALSAPYLAAITSGD